MVAPAPTDPDRAAKLDESAYRTLFARLSELVGTLVLDCGTGLDDPPARAALACADQLVLVCDDEPDTASIVAEAASWLRHAGPPLTLVVNNQRRRSRIDLAALERATDFAHGLAVVPRDERGAGQLHNSRFTWKHAPDGWTDPDPGARGTARSRLAKPRDRPVTTPAITSAQRRTISILQRVRGAHLSGAGQRAGVRRTEIPSAANTSHGSRALSRATVSAVSPPAPNPEQVTVSAHAVEQYRDRVKPGLDPGRRPRRTRAALRARPASRPRRRAGSTPPDRPPTTCCSAIRSCCPSPPRPMPGSRPPASRSAP